MFGARSNVSYLLSHQKLQQDVARPCSVGRLTHRKEQDGLYNKAKPPAIIKELQKAQPHLSTCFAIVAIFSHSIVRKYNMFW